MSKVPEPVSITDQYLHAMVIRLDALCHMTSSLIEHIAKEEGIATSTNHVVEEKPKKVTRKRKEG